MTDLNKNVLKKYVETQNFDFFILNKMGDFFLIPIVLYLIRLFSSYNDLNVPSIFLIMIYIP